ncbi:MAG TPA: hypothetical protein VLA98_04050, partial [Solirubrobacteraceae bacterium]|nr:hypothetical protein [Solirubrobacteraceae bacterium]
MVAAVTAVAVAVLAAVGGVAAPPARAAGTAGDEVATAIARAWVPRQRPDGTFSDYIVALRPSGRDVYGTAMLGTALLLHGLRTG